VTASQLTIPMASLRYASLAPGGPWLPRYLMHWKYDKALKRRKNETLI